MKILILKPSSGVAAEVVKEDMEDTQGDVDKIEDIDTEAFFRRRF